jgi:hypothetical protein
MKPQINKIWMKLDERDFLKKLTDENLLKYKTALLKLRTNFGSISRADMMALVDAEICLR